MTPLQEQLTRACEALGLTWDLNYTATLSSGSQIRAEVRIKGLGADKGMLIVTDYDDIRDIEQELVGGGYGYSVLSELSPDEDFDLQDYREMFEDWGWEPEGE
jgi:hypothetical protein